MTLGCPTCSSYPLPAHRFDEHGKVQHAAPVHHEAVRRRTGLHAQGEILLQFPVEPLLDMAGSHVLAVTAEEGGIVDGKESMLIVGSSMAIGSSGSGLS